MMETIHGERDEPGRQARLAVRAHQLVGVPVADDRLHRCLAGEVVSSVRHVRVEVDGVDVADSRQPRIAALLGLIGTVVAVLKR